MQDELEMSDDSDDEVQRVPDPSSGSAGNASKTIMFYSVGVGNSPYDFHRIINRRKHHSGSEV